MKLLKRRTSVKRDFIISREGNFGFGDGVLLQKEGWLASSLRGWSEKSDSFSKQNSPGYTEPGMQNRIRVWLWEDSSSECSHRGEDPQERPLEGVLYDLRLGWINNQRSSGEGRTSPVPDKEGIQRPWVCPPHWAEVGAFASVIWVSWLRFFFFFFFPFNKAFPRIQKSRGISLTIIVLNVTGTVGQSLGHNSSNKLSSVTCPWQSLQFWVFL